MTISLRGKVAAIGRLLFSLSVAEQYKIYLLSSDFGAIYFCSVLITRCVCVFFLSFFVATENLRFAFERCHRDNKRNKR